VFRLFPSPLPYDRTTANNGSSRLRLPTASAFLQNATAKFWWTSHQNFPYSLSLCDIQTMQILKSILYRLARFYLLIFFSTAASPITITQIESHFGGKVVQKFGDKLWLYPETTSTRIFVAMAYASQVTSLFDGRVIFSGYLQGFNGLSVQVQAPNGDILTYSCLSRVSTKKSADIRKGQPLGFSGGDGDKCGGHPGVSLYLLRNSIRINPLDHNLP